MSPRLSTPAPPHNSLLAPGLCGCVDCSRIVLGLRCPVVGGGLQCGDYRKHGGHHTMLVATSFLIAAERVRLDARATPREGGESR